MGIHDISRTESSGKPRLPRFNMPLELGMFLGAKQYGDGQQKDKAAWFWTRNLSGTKGSARISLDRISVRTTVTFKSR